MEEEKPRAAVQVIITKGGGPGGITVSVVDESGSPIKGEDSPPPAGEIGIMLSENPICFWYNGKRYCR